MSCEERLRGLNMLQLSNKAGEQSSIDSPQVFQYELVPGVK